MMNPECVTAQISETLVFTILPMLLARILGIPVVLFAHRFRVCMTLAEQNLAGVILGSPLTLLASETFRVAIEYVSQTISKPDKSKHEDGHPVVIMLGLSRDGHAVATLLEHYRELGYDAMYFSEGSNTGRQGDLDD